MIDNVWYDIGITMLGLTLILFVYTLPSCIAYMRDHRNLIKIATVNVLFGFLIIPWIIMLLYASFSQTKGATSE